MRRFRGAVAALVAMGLGDFGSKLTPRKKGRTTRRLRRSTLRRQSRARKLAAMHCEHRRRPAARSRGFHAWLARA